MTVLITLTTIGYDAGPFDLYSDVDGYTTAFATGIDGATLLAGYLCVTVPDGTVTIRVTSTGDCVNSIDIPVIMPSTTTTTAPPTTSTTTTYSVTPCSLFGDPASNVVVDNFTYYEFTFFDNLYLPSMNVTWQPPIYPWPPSLASNTRAKGERANATSSALSFTFDPVAGAGNVTIYIYVNGILKQTLTKTPAQMHALAGFTSMTLNIPTNQCLYIRLESADAGA